MLCFLALVDDWFNLLMIMMIMMIMMMMMMIFTDKRNKFTQNIVTSENISGVVLCESCLLFMFMCICVCVCVCVCVVCLCGMFYS